MRLFGGIRASVHSPPQCSLLVLDSALGGQYTSALLGPFKYVRIDPRPGRGGSTLFLSPTVIAGSLIRMMRGGGDPRWNWKKKLAYCYFATLIDRVRPRAVLSLRGGFTLWFSKLATEFTDIEFCAVASAQVHASHARNVLPSRAHYYVYGEFDREQLAGSGQESARIHAVGPLLGGYFQASGGTRAETRYDLCIPSQVVELALEKSDRATASDRPTLLYIQRRLAEYVSRFARDRALRVAVALRPQEPSEAGGSERRFFEEIMDCDCDIIASEPERFSTYHAIAASRVVVTHCSTIGFEVLSWPKKVLFCAFAPYEPYRLPEILDWSVRVEDYEAFSRALERLLELDEGNYAAGLKDVASYFNGYVASAPPHVVIATRLRHALGSKSSIPGRDSAWTVETAAGTILSDRVRS